MASHCVLSVSLSSSSYQIQTLGVEEPRGTATHSLAWHFVSAFPRCLGNPTILGRDGCKLIRHPCSCSPPAIFCTSPVVTPICPETAASKYSSKARRCPRGAIGLLGGRCNVLHKRRPTTCLDRRSIHTHYPSLSQAPAVLLFLGWRLNTVIFPLLLGMTAQHSTASVPESQNRPALLELARLGSG